MHMKKATNITLATLAAALLASSCIKEADPYEIATEDQVTLETLIEGIPASLVQAGSAGYAKDGQAWDFALPAIHIATESMTGDVAIGGNIGYDWFAQWGTNEALGADYAVGALTWNNYYAWIMAANNVIKQIDASDFATLDATQKSYLGFAYAYRAMFYLDLVRLYEFKENNYTEAPGVLGLGVPIVLPETTESEAKNNPRAKVDDIYDQVIFPDLDKAEELLSGFTAPDKYTISPALVYGLKARAWLERGTAKNDAEAYVSAAEYARLAASTATFTTVSTCATSAAIRGSIPTAKTRRRSPTTTKAAVKRARNTSMNCPITRTSSSVRHRALMRISRSAEPQTIPTCASRRCTSSRPRPRRMKILAKEFGCSMSS